MLALWQGNPNNMTVHRWSYENRSAQRQTECLLHPNLSVCILRGIVICPNSNIGSTIICHVDCNKVQLLQSLFCVVEMKSARKTFKKKQRYHYYYNAPFVQLHASLRWLMAMIGRHLYWASQQQPLDRRPRWLGRGNST